jgi:hypothetical protein
MTTLSTGPIGAAANTKIDVGKFICKGRSLGGARFFEFHDQQWFPKSLRDGVTDALQFILCLSGIYRPIVPPAPHALLIYVRAVADPGYVYTDCCG